MPKGHTLLERFRKPHLDEELVAAENIGELVDSVINVPQVDPLFSPVVNAVVLQLIAHYVAKQRGCPIDFPKNLAKTVTVE